MSDADGGDAYEAPSTPSAQGLLSSFSPRNFFSSSFSRPSPVTPSSAPDAADAVAPSSLLSPTALAQQRHMLRLKKLSATSQLKKTLGWRQLTSLGIGCTIGAGIFVVTGSVARYQTGPALFLSVSLTHTTFLHTSSSASPVPSSVSTLPLSPCAAQYIVSGITCLLAALCYAEFAAMSPSAGSAYAYARGTMGEVVGWVIGWDLCLEYGVAAATVAQSWSSHFAQFVALCGGDMANSKLNAPFWSYDPQSGQFGITGSGFDIMAILITLAVTCVLYRGIKESASFNNWMVGTKLAVVLFVIFVGSAYVDNANYTPFLPFGFAGISFFGNVVVGQVNGNGDPSGVLAGAAIVFFAYIGFDAVSCQAEECKSPQTDLPIGIIGSLGISALLYVAVSLVLVGMVPYQTIDQAVGVSAAFGAHGLVWAEYFIDLGAIIGMTSVLLVTMMGQPRVMLAMARDGLLPESFFGAVHPKYGTPYKTTVLTGVAVALLASFVPLSILVELVSIGTLLAFLIVCVSVLVLRRTNPDLPRPFRCPWVPAVPLLGAFLCLMLMLSLPGSNWYRLAIWLAIGMAVYGFWGRKNAAKMRAEREAREKEEDGEGNKTTDEIEMGEFDGGEKGGENGEESKEEQEGVYGTADVLKVKGMEDGEEVEKTDYEDTGDDHAALNSMRSSDD